MSVIQFANGTKVRFDGNPTPADVEEVAQKLNLSGGGGSRETPQKEDGLLKSLIKEPIKTLLVKPAARATEALGRLGVFGPQAKLGYEEMEREGAGQELSTLAGKYKIEPQKAFGQGGAKQILGEGLESAAYLAPVGVARGAATVAQGAAKTTIPRAFMTGAKQGAAAGAMFGAGEGLQQDEGLGGIAKRAATGAAVGGIAGGALSAGFTGARQTIFGRQSTQEEAERAAGRIFQAPKARGAAQQRYVEKTGAQVLSKIDTKDIKTYDDLSRTLESHIDKGLRKVDAALGLRNTPVPLKELESVASAKVGGRTVSSKFNYVKQALEDLGELFTKTRNQVDRLRIMALSRKAETTGLTAQEVNEVAREYGTTFGNKAFNKNGEALTSVNAGMFETTRKGVKAAARGLLEGDAAKAADAEVTQMIRLKKLSDDLNAGLNSLENRVVEPGMIEKIFRQAGNIVDIATFGGPRAFVQKLFFPSNVGLKTMDIIDIQNEVAKNLRTIRNLEGASDSVVAAKLRDLAGLAGIPTSPSVFGARAKQTLLASD